MIMTTNHQSSGGANQKSANPGGTSDKTGDDQSHVDDDVDLDDDDNDDVKPSKVDYKSHRRAIDQLKAEKKRSRELADQLKSFQDREAENERKKNEKDGNYQAMLEAERAKSKQLEDELVATKAQNESFVEREVSRKKLSALCDSLGGQVNAELIWRLADLEKIAVDPETGEIDKTSLTKYTERFRKKWPDVIPSAGKLPNEKPGAGQKPADRISRADYVKLPSKEMASWAKKEMEFPGTIID